ncbi:MAG: nucleotidyltransferase domain-containing protein [Phascolarctobacterium sp.]|nr:nucleotidyltransferase domain-containing protein [Phascolarctobacterium sp.]
MCNKEKLNNLTKVLVKKILTTTDKVDRIVIYGSQAKGTSLPESDIDILVILNTNEADTRAIKRKLWSISNAVSLDYDEVISLVVSSKEEYDKMYYSLYNINVESEGVELYGRAS